MALRLTTQQRTILERRTAIARLLYYDMHISYYKWADCIWINGELVVLFGDILK